MNKSTLKSAQLILIFYFLCMSITHAADNLSKSSNHHTKTVKTIEQLSHSKQESIWLKLKTPKGKIINVKVHPSDLKGLTEGDKVELMNTIASVA